jgi:hypothetical protein
VLAMPIRLFWSMCSHLDRISAERDLGLLEVMSVAQCSDANTHREFRAALTERVGTPVRREMPKSSKADILALIKEV